MRKNTCDLALSETAGLFSDPTHPEGGGLQDDHDSCESISHPVAEVPADAVENLNVLPQKKSFANLLLQAMRVIFTCWYRAFEVIFDVLTNKWAWNVILITLYVLFDVFFHLVLAASAIMVTIIINMDNVYRKTDDDEEYDADSNATSCTDLTGVCEKEPYKKRK